MDVQYYQNNFLEYPGEFPQVYPRMSPVSVTDWLYITDPGLHCNNPWEYVACDNLALAFPTPLEYP